MNDNMKRMCGEVMNTARSIYEAQIVEGFTNKEAVAKVHYFIEGVRCSFIWNDNITTGDFSDFNEVIRKFEIRLVQKS